MRTRSALRWGSLFLGGALVFAGSASAQRIQGAKAPARAPAYDLSREVTLVGTVLKVTENSDMPPIGAHVLLQTASGSVDVHLGEARFLKLNKFSVTEGDALRVIGQTVASGDGAVFLARIVQHGTQALAVRTVNGMPLGLAGARANPGAQASVKQGGAL